jgi:hypothetical protein
MAENCRQRTGRLALAERVLSDISALLQPKEGFKKSLSMSGEVGLLAGDEIVSHERSQRADPHTTLNRDTRGHILRIIVVACLGMLIWQAIIAAGSL